MQQADRVGSAHLDDRRVAAGIVDEHDRRRQHRLGRGRRATTAAVRAGPFGEPRRQRQLPGQGSLHVGRDHRPVGSLPRFGDPELRCSHPLLVAVCTGADNVDAVQREHTGETPERAGTVVVDDDDPRPIDLHRSLAGAHQGQDVGRRERRTALLTGLATVGHAEPHPNPLDQLLDELGLPRAPRRRPRRQRIGLGQRVQEVEEHRIAHRLGNHVDGRRVVEIATGGDVGQQQMVTHQRHEVGRVAFVEAHPSER